MDVAATASALKTAEAQAEAGVKISKNSRDQAEKVIGILLSGIQEVALPEGKGKKLNVTA